MGIGEQFAGLDMKNLIGGPLSAAADSSIILANSTADFINRVGFVGEGEARNVKFGYEKNEPNEDGTFDNQKMMVEVPLLAIVPIPNLQIDEVNILFDMEVKQCEKSESAFDMSAGLNASAGFGPVKISISGSVSAHNSNTRSSDNSAKYHVDVRATNHGTPEGLARVLDMMSATISPSLISSKPVDGNGNELVGKSREKNIKMKALREKQFQLENSSKSSKEIYDIKFAELKKEVERQKNAEILELAKKQSDTNEKDQKDIIQKNIDDTDAFWSDISGSLKTKIEIAASSDKKFEDLFSARDGKAFVTIPELFENTKTALKDSQEKEKAVNESKIEYNNLMMSN